MKKCSFFKYQSFGNDFILIEDEDGSFLSHYKDEIPLLCERRFGIGADGILLLQPSLVADYKMRIFNSDGSEASMCGNGLACLSLHISKDSSIETGSGISSSKLEGDALLISFPKAIILEEERFLTSTVKGRVVDTGTPHFVIFTNDLEDPSLIDLAKTHRTNHNMNVTLARIDTSDFLTICTFEKGVLEETLSCGTGGAAAALLFGKKSLTVRYPSLQTTEFFIDSVSKVWMKATPNLTFIGTLDFKKPFIKSNFSPRMLSI